MISEKIIYNNRKDILITNDQSKIIEEMIEEYVENIISETIPERKYNNEWNPKLLKNKSKEVFDLIFQSNLGLKKKVLMKRD